VLGKGARRKAVLMKIAKPRLDRVFEKGGVLQMPIGVAIEPADLEGDLEHIKPLENLRE
jgi:hypothetical protein